MPRVSGITLLVTLLLLSYLTDTSRPVFREERPPAFFVPEDKGKVLILLDKGFPEPGVHQFSDGSTLNSVINVTLGEGFVLNVSEKTPVETGEMLAVESKLLKNLNISRRYMPAGQRIALGIALHPDKMSLEDWEVLPGIGPAMAARIEEDRQLNGDFHSLENLLRVRGIGKRRIQSWKQYF